jgi:hypothetical protein
MGIAGSGFKASSSGAFRSAFVAGESGLKDLIDILGTRRSIKPLVELIMSDKANRFVGQAVLTKLMQHFKVHANPPLERYVVALGEK